MAKCQTRVTKGAKRVCNMVLTHLQMVQQSVERQKVGSTMVMASIKETSKPWRAWNEKIRET
jgi:hypothetical protein